MLLAMGIGREWINSNKRFSARKHTTNRLLWLFWATLPSDVGVLWTQMLGSSYLFFFFTTPCKQAGCSRAGLLYWSVKNCRLGRAQVEYACRNHAWVMHVDGGALIFALVASCVLLQGGIDTTLLVPEPEPWKFCLPIGHHCSPWSNFASVCVF